jgi:hypothetical protein
VAAGTYTLTASATGFDSSSQSVTVTADVTTTATFDLTPSTATPTPTATATPACEAEDLAASPSPLSLKRNKSGTITVTVTCEDGTPVEGEAVTASTNKAGSKRVSIAGSPGTTDANGEVEFTITAKKKTGNAVVTIKSGSLTKNVTVKVRK